MLRLRYTNTLLAAAFIVLASACLADTEPLSAVPAAAPMDLTSGRIDATPLGGGGQEANLPQSPPQTVEGTLVSVDASGSFLTVRTLRVGDVKIGLPENMIISRNGVDSVVGDIKPGDRVYATVVTASGNRALRLVSESPANPLMNVVGIPVLALIALVIWRIRVKTAPAQPAKATAKAG
jgi:hypothetical protein